MSLNAIFAQFEVPGRLPDGVKFVGPQRQDDHGKAPRITWSPISAVHTRPRRFGGGPGDDGEIMQRTWTIRVEVWGDDLDGTVVLVNAFLASAHELLSKHGYGNGREAWNPGGVSASGSVCVLLFELITPIPREPKPYRPITEVNTTATLVTS